MVTVIDMVRREVASDPASASAANSQQIIESRGEAHAVCELQLLANESPKTTAPPVLAFMDIDAFLDQN